MSWGERSCTLYGSCTHKPEFHTCNVNCPYYVWNGKTKPDSVKTVKPFRRSGCPICGKTECRCGYGPEHQGLEP